jgi:hypothetical protein
VEGKAVLSLVLGLMSMGCAGPVLGLPAIILGSIARRDVDRAGGALTGRAIAAGGIVSGLFGTGFGVVIVLWIMGAALAPDVPAESTATMPAPAVTDTAPPSEGSPPPATTTPAPSSGTRSYGSLEVVDLDRSRSLHTQLVEITQQSRGRTVVLQTFAQASSACAAVAAALPDKRMQRALANVTLVRVDVEEYATELHHMKIETTTAPWFYKLDANGDPTDSISADAWDASIPENMAPVLGRFVHRATPPALRAPPALHAPRAHGRRPNR